MSTENKVVPEAAPPEALRVTEGIPTPPAAPAEPLLPRKGKIALNKFATASDAVLIVLVGQILKGLTGNAHFATPVPALADIQAARDAFATAVSAGRVGPQAVEKRRGLRAKLVALLRSLALYVQQESQGEREILLGTGFPLQRQGVAGGKPAAPTGLRLKRGKVSGELLARCNPLVTDVVYQWRYALATAPGAWTVCDPTFAARFALGGLVAGTSYAIQVRAVGRHGAGDWSDAVVLMVA